MKCGRIAPEGQTLEDVMGLEVAGILLTLYSGSGTRKCGF